MQDAAARPTNPLATHGRAIQMGHSRGSRASTILFEDETDTSDVTDDSDPGDFLELEDIWVIHAGVNRRF